MNKNICERIERYAIIGIAFFLPLSSGAVNTLIAIGIGFWLLGKILRKEARLAPTGMNLLFLLFFIACSLSFIHSVDARTSLQGLVKVLKYFGIFFLLAEGVRDLKTLKNVLIALIAGTAIVCIDGIAQYIIGKDLFCRHPLMHDVGLNRMTATYRHCNDLGVYLVTVVGVIGTLALYKLKGIKRWGALAVALLIIICIALTFSRGAALGLCGAALIIGIVRRDKLILGLMGAGLVALPFVMPGSVKAWAGSTHSFLEFFCNLDRLSFYRSAIEMIKAHPFVGVGINTFSRVYVNYKVPDVGIITPTTCYAHNNFLQMGAEIGLIGLGIFLVIITVFFFRMGKAYAQKERPEIVRIVALGVICAVAAFLLNGLTESSFYFSKLVVLLWFMMGLGSSLIFLKE